MTDKELQRLIEDVENNYLISAPKSMKSNIYAEINRQRKAKNRIRNINYNMKVLAGMAAAIGIFCFLPFRTDAEIYLQDKRIERIEERYQNQEEHIMRQHKKNQLIEEIKDKINTNILEVF